MNKTSLLKLRCLGDGWGRCFRAAVFDSQGHCVYDDCLGPGEQKMISLCPGEYEVKFRNFVGLDPRGFTKWVSLEEGCEYELNMVFRRHVQPARSLRLTVRDANYPNIVPMNGGITVWLNRTM